MLYEDLLGKRVHIMYGQDDIEATGYFVGFKCYLSYTGEPCYSYELAGSMTREGLDNTTWYPAGYLRPAE